MHLKVDLDNTKYRLVHGNCAILPQDEAVNHAWIEEGDVIHDVSNRRHIVVDRKTYYEAFEVKNVRIYSKLEMMKLTMHFRHWGPWP